VIADEYARLERESMASRNAKLLLDERSAELARMQTHLSRQQSQQQDIVERAKAVEDELRQLQTDYQQTQLKLLRSESGESRLHAQLRAVEAEREEQRAVLERMTAERSRWMLECVELGKRLQEEAAQSERHIVSVTRERDRLVVQVAELEATIEKSTERIHQLNETLSEQSLLYESLRIKQMDDSAYKGSIMSEIEELVLSQRDHDDHEDVQHSASLSFLDTLLPRVADSRMARVR
jgi:septal ring factor EnvC (AmiA/AmiB activator)